MNQHPIGNAVTTYASFRDDSGSPYDPTNVVLTHRYVAPKLGPVVVRAYGVSSAVVKTGVGEYKCKLPGMLLTRVGEVACRWAGTGDEPTQDDKFLLDRFQMVGHGVADNGD